MKRRTLQPVIIFTSFVMACVCSGESRYIEAEDCEGLTRYPYANEDSSGWYAREACTRAYGAPGKCYCAAIHENATDREMSLKLDTPLKPGKYRIFIRTVGPYVVSGKTELRIDLDKTPVVFTWEKGPGRGIKYFRWQEGKEVELKNAVSEITVTAVRFGGKGRGIINAPFQKSIWLDTIYITDNLDAKTPPDFTEELAIRKGTDDAGIPERHEYRADIDGPARGRTPEPVGKEESRPVVLQSFDGRKNMWPNSSLELGMNDGWMVANNGNHVLSDADLDKNNPFHGKYSLHVPGQQRKAYSRPYYLDKDTDAMFSLYLRGNGKLNVDLMKFKEFGKYQTVTAEKMLSASSTPTGEWKRLSATGSLQEGWYFVVISSDKEFWVDAIQLEPGNAVSEYAPRAKLEGAIRSGAFANTIYDGTRTMDVWFHNSDKKAINASLAYRIKDVREVVVAEGNTDAITVEPGTTVTKSLPILPEQRGMFSVWYTVKGREMPEGETPYLKMPAPDLKTEHRHEYGANIHLTSTDLAVHSRLGYKWVLTCKSRQLGSAEEKVHPKPDEWNWCDEQAALPAKYDMGVIPCIWPHRTPGFMEQPVDSMNYRPVRGGCPDHTPAPKVWDEYVDRVVGHYSDRVKTWCLDDEIECAWPVTLFAEYANNTCKLIREKHPEIRIAWSMIPDFTEEMFHYIDPALVDYIGGSYFDQPHWDARKSRYLKEKYKKKLICYGVGGRYPLATMYHTYYTYNQPPYWKAARMARRVVNLWLAHDMDIPGHYASIIAPSYHVNRNKPMIDYDGTPLVWGGTYACLGTLLADAVPIDDYPLGNTGRRAYVFKCGDRIGAAVWSTSVQHDDYNFRPAQRELQTVEIPVPGTKVNVLDMYWNTRNDVKKQKDNLILDLNEEPTFIMTDSVSVDDLVKALAKSRTAPTGLCAEMALEKNTEGGIDLRVDVINNMKMDLADVTVDFRLAGKQPWSMNGKWLLKRNFARVGKVPAGKTGSVKLPTTLDSTSPYEYGQIRAHINTDNAKAASDQVIWMIPAARQETAPEIDGNIEHWQGHNAAWMCYDWSWTPVTRHLINLYARGECFSYPPYRVDARAAIWTGWDEKNLYVAAKLDDDFPILDKTTGEKITLVIKQGDTEKRVEISPQSDGKVVMSGIEGATAACSLKNEKRHNGAAFKLEDIQSINVEIALPWKSLGMGCDPGRMAGFDFFWTDVDPGKDGIESGTLRWAGEAVNTGFLCLAD